MAIGRLVNNSLKQIDLKCHHSGNGSRYGGGSSVKSNMTCRKCGKKGHINKDCRSKVNDSSGNPPKKYANDLPEWVNRKPVVSDTKDLATYIMTRNNNKYKCCTS